MPSEKHGHVELTPARDGLPRSKRVPALSAMAALAIIAIGSLPINDAKAGWTYGAGYSYGNQGGRQNYNYGYHQNYKSGK